MISSDSPHYRQVKDAENSMSGCFHILAVVCHKAKRISSSTSTAETLSAVVGKELGQLVAIRLTGIFSTGTQIPLRCKNPLQTLIQIQEKGEWCLPIDHYTDCREHFQFVVGEKGVPQDRYQRLYVLSLREDRINGAIRRFIWIPTCSMLVDPLTKPMISKVLFDMLTQGFWQMTCKGPQGQKQLPLLAPALAPNFKYTEADLQHIQTTPMKEFDIGDYKNQKRCRLVEVNNFIPLEHVIESSANSTEFKRGIQMVYAFL